MFGRKKKIYRQGDVLLKEVKAFPDKLEKKNKILAYGEVTGHKHQFLDKNTLVFTDKDGQQYVEVLGKSSDLVHEEHAKINIPKGKYEVAIQKEYDPIEAEKLAREKQAEKERKASRRVYD